MKKARILFGALAITALLSACRDDASFPSGGHGDVETGVKNSDTFAVLQSKSAKRGVAFGFTTEADYDLLMPSISWCYNWASGGQNKMSKLEQYGVEYNPMCWNGNFSADNIVEKFSSVYPSSTALLAYNEPNLTDQANMTPAQAATYWPEVLSIVERTGKRLVSPAMNWGTLSGWSDGVKWLDSFFQQSGVSVDDVDAIAVHVYMSSATALMGDIERYKKFGKPIWLTEFCNWQAGSEEAQMKFMSHCFNALEQDDDVERYAWFTPRGSTSVKGMNLLTSKSPIALTNTGILFTNFSTFDQKVVYPLNQRIPAEHYRACAEKAMAVLPSADTDDEGVLMLSSFSKGHWVDYKVDFDGSKNGAFLLRYASANDFELTISSVDSDGNATPWQTITMPGTGKKTNWTTAKVSLELPSSAAVIRLSTGGGMVNINWLEFTN